MSVVLASRRWLRPWSTPRERTSRLTFSLAVAIVWLVAVAYDARAADSRPPGAASTEVTADDKALFDSGVAAYDAKDYDVALERFRAAYARTRSPVILFNIAQTLRRKGDCAEALKSYQRFQAEAPQRAEALGVGDRISELRTNCPISNTDVRPVRVEAPVTEQGSPPETATIPTVALKEPQSSSRPSELKPWAVAFIGASLGMGALGGYEWYAADRAANQITALAAEGVPWNGYATALERQWQRQREVAWLGIGAAALALLTSVTIQTWDRWHLSAKKQ